MPHDVLTPVPPLIELKNAGKRYPTAEGSFSALSGVDLAISRGEFVMVVGASGSGKSTLLSLLAGIDRPSEGEVIIDGTAVHALSERAMSAWRGRAVGIVFQFFQLLPTLTAAENVMLPMDVCGTWVPKERRERAMTLLDSLGVADQANKLPSRLSGGQQQRVAIARALANDPPLLLADEPTGNLDTRTSYEVLALLQKLNRERGITIIIVTHEPDIAACATRTINVQDGRIKSDIRNPKQRNAAEELAALPPPER